MRITYKQIFFLLFFAIYYTIAHAQVELDVSNAKDVETAAFICSKSFHISPFQGAGNTTMNDECIPNEVNAVWLNWESLSVGKTLTFTITPDNPDVNIDFILFESDNKQAITNPDPRKCSTSTCTGVTGLRTGAANAQADPGTCNTTTDNGFLSPAIQFQNFYALLIHSTSDDNGFTIEFGGDTEFAGPRPSIVSSIPNEACYGQDVTFTLPNSFDDTDVINYEWDFGLDASTPTLTTTDKNENPVITYTSNGEKTITLTVESAFGCSVTTEYTMMIGNCCTTNNSISVDTTLVKVVSCPSDADGAINLDVVTTSPLTPQIAWSNSETTKDIAGLSAGIYGVTVTNEAGCEATLDDIVLETPDVLKLEIPDIIFDDCRAGAEVVVYAAAEGGRAPYLYNFGLTQDTLPKDSAMLQVGTHLITVKDGSGCTDTTTTEVLLRDLIIETSNIKNAPCKDSIGSVDIDVEIGTAPFTFDFGNGLTDNTALPADDYTVTVTDANECTGTAEVPISEPDELFPFVDGLNFPLNCFGDIAAPVTVDPSGGTPIYDYLWEDGSTSKERGSLPAGTYSVTVTDANGCSATEEGTISQPDALEVQIVDSKDAACSNTMDGSIQLRVNGGTGDYAYSTDGTNFIAFPADSILTNLTPADYSIIIEDDNGCKSTPANATIDSPPAIIISIDSIMEVTNCDANNNGGLIISAEGGQGPYTYEFLNDTGIFSTNTTGQILDSLPSDVYTVIVNDANGCPNSRENIQINKIELDIEVDNTTDLTCFEDNSGIVELSINGSTNTQDFLFDITNTNTLEGDTVLTQLAAREYGDMIVIDANGCQGAVPQFELEQPPQFMATITGTNTSALCFEDTVSLSAESIGGTAPYQYLWDNGSDLIDRENVKSGDYQLTITDDNGCVDIAEITITKPDSIEVQENSFTDVSCAGEEDGTIKLQVKGGTGDYAYSTNGNVFTAFPSDSILTNLAPADYTITIEDDNSCQSAPINVTINSPTAITSTDSIIDVTNCLTDDNGGIIVTASGGAGDYTYYFTTPTDTFEINKTGEVLNSLSAGDYTVFISDANDCSISNDGIEISKINLEVDTISTENLKCYEDGSGEVLLSINGDTNTSDFVFEIANDNNQLGDTILSSLSANILYEIEVYDANGCQGTAPSFTLSEPEEIRFITPTNRPICFGTSDASVAIDPSGGTGALMVFWSTGDIGKTIAGLPKGDYTVRVEDENNCSTGDVPFSISENPRIEVSNLAANEVECPDNPNGSITLDVAGGVGPYEYSIDGGMTFGEEDILTGLTANQYDVIIQDMAGCDTTLSATITSPTKIEPLTLSLLECFGDEISISPFVSLSSGDNVTEVLWDFGPGATPATGTGMGEQNVLYQTLGALEITLTVTTEKCGELSPHIVSSEDNPLFTLEPCCDLNSITLNAIPDSTSCANTEDGRINLEIENQDAVTLPNVISWEGIPADSEMVDNLAAGTYTVTVTNQADCSETTTATVASPEEIKILATSTDPSCGGGSDGVISIMASGGTGNYRYDFGGSGFQDESSVDDFLAGTYDLIVVDSKDCQEEGIITLAEKELETDPADITEPNCFGEDNGIVVVRVTNGNGPYEYNINGNGFESSEALSSLSAGNYSIAIRDAEQCLGAIDVIVTEPDEVEVNMQTVQNISCFGERDGQLRATAIGGDNNFSYDWNIGGTDALVTNLAPGDYVVTVTDGKGCMGIQNGIMIEPDLLSAQSTPRAVFCFGQTNGAITVTGEGGTAPYAYSMDGVFFQPVETFNNLPSGDYSVFVQDAGGCTAESNATVDEPGEFELIATQDQEVQLGSEIQLQAVVTDDTGVVYTWSGPDSLSCNNCSNPRLMPSQSGTYFVTATNPGDCSASDTINVKVSFDRPIYFPEAFSPNGDGINDRFYVQGSSAIRVVRRLSIFDRFGALLYDQTMIQPNDSTIGWDGMLDGRAVSIGVYVVRAEVEFIDGEVITYTRDVTVAKNNQ